MAKCKCDPVVDRIHQQTCTNYHIPGANVTHTEIRKSSPLRGLRLRSEILSARIIWLRGTLAIIEYHANLHQMTQRIRRQSTAAAAAPSLKVEHTLAIIRFVNHYYRRLCVLPFVFAAQFTRPKPGGGNAIIVFMEVRSAMLQLPECGRPPLS